MIQKAVIPYADQGASLEGFAAYPSEKNRPVVILCHGWKGRDEYICEKAEEMARWGYIGFALDMYGKGVIGKSKEENAALKKPFLEDRLFLKNRLLKAFDAASLLPYADTSRIAALGFGFGGLCALDLARSGANLKGAISSYGHFEPPGLPKNPIKAKILVLHGYNDAIVTLSDLAGFEKEMNDAKADWRTVVYGNTVHAFTNPSANDPAFGTVYNPASAKRAWVEIQTFLEEIFDNS